MIPPSIPSITAISPGKVILSGEHSIAYAQPALALAMDRQVVTTVTPNEAREISIAIHGQDTEAHTLDELPLLVERLDNLYGEFIAGNRPIRKVLVSPMELLFYTVALTQPTQGFHIHMSVNIPHGSGMGSSAAIILSLLRALMPNLANTPLMTLAIRAENLQHGRSSGIDLHTCLHGGLHFFQAGQVNRLDATPIPFDLVQTGVPETSTGECVSQVRDLYGNSTLWSEFGQVTRDMVSAIRQGDSTAWLNAVQSNHALLSKIGVVPEPVASFIRQVEERGGAAKICGAGAVRGERGGIVLVSGIPDVAALATKHGYEHISVQMDPHGTRMG